MISESTPTGASTQLHPRSPLNYHASLLQLVSSSMTTNVTAMSTLSNLNMRQSKAPIPPHLITRASCMVAYMPRSSVSGSRLFNLLAVLHNIYSSESTVAKLHARSSTTHVTDILAMYIYTLFGRCPSFDGNSEELQSAESCKL